MDDKTSMQGIKDKIRKFNTERDWDRYNKPKELIMALQEELGELSRCYLWVSEEELKNMHSDPEKFNAIKEEIADLFIYLITLANRLGIDISDTIFQELDKNAKRFPPRKLKSKHTNLLVGEKAAE